MSLIELAKQHATDFHTSPRHGVEAVHHRESDFIQPVRVEFDCEWA
jgi:hypothetical protein